MKRLAKQADLFLFSVTLEYPVQFEFNLSSNVETASLRCSRERWLYLLVQIISKLGLNLP